MGALGDGAVKGCRFVQDFEKPQQHPRSEVWPPGGQFGHGRDEYKEEAGQLRVGRNVLLSASDNPAQALAFPFVGLKFGHGHALIGK